MTDLQWQLTGACPGAGRVVPSTESKDRNDNTSNEERDRNDEQRTTNCRYVGPLTLTSTASSADTGARCP